MAKLLSRLLHPRQQLLYTAFQKLRKDLYLFDNHPHRHRHLTYCCFRNLHHHRQQLPNIQPQLGLNMTLYHFHEKQQCCQDRWQHHSE
jgi:hypothetical protein